MSTQNGQNVCPKCKSVTTSGDTRYVSKKVKMKLYPAQVALLDFINVYDALQLIQSLEWVHDTALYHSDQLIEEEEKSILFNIKLLIDKLDGIVEEV